MQKTKPCPHCGQEINLAEFIPKRKTRFTSMTPEQRKQAAAVMAAKRWAAKSSSELIKSLDILTKEAG